MELKLKALVLLPSTFDDAEIKFDMDTFIVTMCNDCLMELNVINVNCSSLSTMAEKVQAYFNEVIQRSPTEMNILSASYLGMIDMLLSDYPNGFPIRQDILDIIHQQSEYRDVKSNTGYYYQFSINEWYGIQEAVVNAMTN